MLFHAYKRFCVSVFACMYCMYVYVYTYVRVRACSSAFVCVCNVEVVSYL